MPQAYRVLTKSSKLGSFVGPAFALAFPPRIYAYVTTSNKSMGCLRLHSKQHEQTLWTIHLTLLIDLGCDGFLESIIFVT